MLFQQRLVAKYAGREINLKKLLCHELSSVPFAIADTAGNLSSTNKAALGKLLEQDVSVETLPTKSTLVHFCEKCTRVDVVFDMYQKESIKSGIRTIRASQSRPIHRKIDGRDVPLLVNWKQFIDLAGNKHNLT